MINKTAHTLVDPQNGNLALRLFSLEDDSDFNEVQRNSYYSLIWITEGKAKLKADFAEYQVQQGALLAFSPYQPFMLSAEGALQGAAIQFHPDFFCIHLHHKDVACSGTLFNNIYEPPLTTVDDEAAQTFKMLIGQMQAQIQNPALAQCELLISYLKIFLITASRLKTAQQPASQANKVLKEPFVLQSLKEAIEKDFRSKHAAGDYAKALNISLGALARITKNHLNKTLTELISERIIIEAKRELYLTNKAIKEIAYELGYDDEYYFSRFFKANTAISPQVYRNTVGSGRSSA